MSSEEKHQHSSNDNDNNNNSNMSSDKESAELPSQTAQNTSSFEQVVAKATGNIIMSSSDLSISPSKASNAESGAPATPEALKSEQQEKDSCNAVVNSNSMYDYMSNSLTASTPEKEDVPADSNKDEKEELPTVNEDVEEAIKPLDTCPTTDSNDGSRDRAKGTKGWLYSRRYWLMCFALLVLALAIAIAIVLALGLLDTEGDDKGSATSSVTGSEAANNFDDVFVSLTDSPTMEPSMAPNTESPSFSPSVAPTNTQAPSMTPSTSPTAAPSSAPSDMPSTIPTVSPYPSLSPSAYPTGIPSGSPSNVPTMTPSAGPTGLPSQSPSEEPTFSPTQSPTVSMSPTMSTFILLTEMLSGVSPPEVLMDTSTPQGKALFWMAREDQVTTDILEASLASTTAEDTTTSKNLGAPATMAEARDALTQRFAIVALDYSMHGTGDAVWSFPRLHECEWSGITCNSNYVVTQINWARQELNGYIVPEIQLLTQLEILDVAQNELTGFVDVFWLLPNLEILYAFENQFSGELGDGLTQMTNLKKLYLGHNNLEGTIPEDISVLNQMSTFHTTRYFCLGHANNNKMLTLLSVLNCALTVTTAYLILHYNNLEGPLPNIRMRNMFHLDLSFNNIGGQLGNNWNLPSLRHFVSGNQFNLPFTLCFHSFAC